MMSNTPRMFVGSTTFQVEVIAKLQNGTTCSSTDRSRGCMGQADAVIKAETVFIDDTDRAVAGARAVDMHPVHYRDHTAAMAELRALVP